MVCPLILSFLLMILLFSVIYDSVSTTSELNNNLARVKQFSVEDEF